MKVIEARILDETHLELTQPLPKTSSGRIEIRLSDASSTENSASPVEISSASLVSTPRPVVEPGAANRAIPGSLLRAREDAWCRSHPEILRRHAGQWLVVEGEQIIAHGKDPARLVKQARAQGVQIPYIFYVEAPRQGVVRLGL